MSSVGKLCLAIFLLFPGMESFAENFPPLTECETQMLNAFTTVEEELQEQFGAYLELEGITMTGKTNNFAAYDRIYSCRTEAICFALQNPSKDTSFPPQMGKCDQLPETVGAFEKEVKADFSTCGNSVLKTTVNVSEIYQRCSAFAETKISLGRSYMTQESIKQGSLENNALLGLKISDIQRKMAVLLDHTRTFTTYFIKIADDLNCTLDTKSGK